MIPVDKAVAKIADKQTEKKTKNKQEKGEK